jgi:murein DD-endopeptidase MepM/ murein hydrolase activator NlpD
MNLRKILSFIFILVLSSCAGMKSGRYVTLDKNYSAKSLAKSLNVPAWKLQEFNKGRSFTKGTTIFVPSKGGVIASELNGRSIASVNYKALRSSSKFLWPVPSSKRVSSGFGRRWGRKHEGIDIAARRGAHIIAADDGVVVYSGKELGGYGNITVIAHSGGFFTVYAHADKNYTRKGQKVYRGQVIAAVGSTGRSTGNHLHFEVRRDSHAFDPKKFFRH